MMTEEWKTQRKIAAEKEIYYYCSQVTKVGEWVSKIGAQAQEIESSPQAQS